MLNQLMWDAQQTADHLKISKPSVYRLVKAGKFAPHYLVGNQFRFVPDEVEQWVRGES